jgi:phosphoglycerate dehydrogenase-like enzyme
MTEKETDRLARFADIRSASLADADGCITSWDSPQLTQEILEAAPNLKVLVHAAGSVKPVVSDYLWERGIRVSSCAPAIGIGVAEHALGLMLSAMKQSYRLNDIAHAGGWRPVEELARIRELYGAVIGVVGAGYVGRHMIKLLQAFDVEVLLYDPFVGGDKAAAMGARKVDRLDDMMRVVDVLTLHAPNLPETRHMINALNLPLMKDGSLIVNTARGSLIDESALYDELKSGRIYACLDVTDPEPPAEDNPLRTLSNVVLTPHIAGTTANNMARIGKYAVDELERFFQGKPMEYEVTKESLLTMA